MKLKLILINNEYDLVRAEHHKGDGTGIWQSSGRELFASTGNLMDIPMLDRDKIEIMLGIPNLYFTATIHSEKEENYPHTDFEGTEKGVDDEHTGQALRGAFVSGFEQGYAEAMKQNKYAFEQGWCARAHQLQDNGWNFDESWSGDELLRYYQQLREWDVEVEMEEPYPIPSKHRRIEGLKGGVNAYLHSVAFPKIKITDGYVNIIKIKK